MNIRQKTILMLLSNGDKNEIQEISQKFNVGNRTIRNDLKFIDDFLKSKFDKSLIHCHEGVVKLINPELLNMEELLEEMDYYTYRLSSKERFLLILADLCSANGYTTISSLAQRYYVSRATINTDIIAMKEYAEEKGIEFISERGKGLKIQASEKQRRKYLTQIINEELNPNESYSQWFSKKMIDDISRILIQVELKYNLFLSDIAFETLTIHIALAIKRFESGLTIEDESFSSNIDSIQYQMSEDIVKHLNKHFNINLPQQEIEYIAVHLGSKSSEILITDDKRDSQLEYYAFEIIRRVSNKIERNLLSDEKLFEALYQHLVACQYRAINNLQLQNPIKEELIESYPELYRQIEEVIRSLGIQKIVDPNSDEISYILIHIATALRRTPVYDEKLNVLLVCGTGIGTAELLRESLNKNFDFHYVASIAKHQVEHYISKNSVDLVISTVDLNCHYPCLVVSPLITKDDIARISKVIYEIKKQPNQNQKSTLKSFVATEVEKLLKKYGSDINEGKLISEIEKIVSNYKKEERKAIMLSDLLNLETIKLKVDCKDWKDSIQKSGNLLLESDYIEQTYIDDAINNVIDLGPYIVITKGIALPHAFNSKGVNKTGLSLITLKNPVEYGSEHNDPVHSVFMLATSDATSHLSALSDLSEFLGHEEFIELLQTSENASEIIEYIKENEEGERRNK